MKDLRVGFIMSTEVGLRTQYLNWRNGLAADLGIRPEWIVINWWKEGGSLEGLPFLPNSLKARFRARIELREGLARGPFDALFIAQERMLHGMNPYLIRHAYFVTADVTAKQLHAFGPLYNKEASGFAFYEQRKHRERCERLRKAVALFPWSRWAAASMVEDYGVAPDRVHVVPPGVDLQKWTLPPRDRAEGPTNILFVGGDFRRKGGDLLLEWAMRTRKRDWMLHLVTRDLVVPPLPNIRVYNRLSPNDPALLRLYQNAHIFALPTRGDCYSIASIEAMATGLPVILSRTGGTEDIVQEGVTGYLIDPGDVAALGERLDDLLDNPDRRTQMGCAARLDAEQRYSAQNNIRQTVEIMRGCLES